MAEAVTGLDFNGPKAKAISVTASPMAKAINRESLLRIKGLQSLLVEKIVLRSARCSTQPDAMNDVKRNDGKIFVAIQRNCGNQQRQRQERKRR